MKPLKNVKLGDTLHLGYFNLKTRKVEMFEFKIDNICNFINEEGKHITRVMLDDFLRLAWSYDSNDTSLIVNHYDGRKEENEKEFILRNFGIKKDAWFDCFGVPMRMFTTKEELKLYISEVIQVHYEKLTTKLEQYQDAIESLGFKGVKLKDHQPIDWEKMRKMAFEFNEPKQKTKNKIQVELVKPLFNIKDYSSRLSDIDIPIFRDWLQEFTLMESTNSTISEDPSILRKTMHIPFNEHIFVSDNCSNIRFNHSDDTIVGILAQEPIKSFGAKLTEGQKRRDDVGKILSNTIDIIPCEIQSYTPLNLPVKTIKYRIIKTNGDKSILITSMNHMQLKAFVEETLPANYIITNIEKYPKFNRLKKTRVSLLFGIGLGIVDSNKNVLQRGLFPNEVIKIFKQGQYFITNFLDWEFLRKAREYAWIDVAHQNIDLDHQLSIYKLWTSNGKLQLKLSHSQAIEFIKENPQYDFRSSDNLVLKMLNFYPR